MYEKGRHKALHLSPQHLLQPTLHTTLNPLHSSCFFWDICKTVSSSAWYSIQLNWGGSPAPPKLPTLRLLWCSDISLLALYAAHSRGFWVLGFYFLSEGYFTAFSFARHHSLLWKWKPCHIIIQGSHKLTVLQTGQVDEIMHGNTPRGGTFHPLERQSEHEKWNFSTHSLSRLISTSPSTFMLNSSFSMRRMNFCLYVKNVSSHFTHSHLHFKYTLQTCIRAVCYADKYDETMMKNYKWVCYSACILYEWIIQKVEEHKLSLWNEHSWFAAATLFGGTHQWHVKALWNTNVIYLYFALIYLS